MERMTPRKDEDQHRSGGVEGHARRWGTGTDAKGAACIPAKAAERGRKGTSQDAKRAARVQPESSPARFCVGLAVAVSAMPREGSHHDANG